MRRHLAYPALAALLLTVALTGCRQEPLPASDDAIRFSVAPAEVSLQTKADTPDGSTYLIAVDKEALLYGSYYVAGSETKTSLFDGSTTLKCTAVSATGSTWSYSPLKYWDKRYKFDFRAVFPTSAIPATGSESGSDKIVVNYTNSDYDLMVASAPGMVKADGPVVNLKFRHACAAVRFLFHDETATDGEPPVRNYYLNSFELQKLYTGGTLTYKGNSANAEVTYGEATSEWQYSGGRAASDVFAWTAADASSRWGVPKGYAGPNNDGWHFIVPQALEDAKLHFTYTVGQNGALILPVTLPLKIGDGTDEGDIIAWEPGKAYTYKITLKANEIVFTVSFGSWGDNVNTEYTPIG